MNAKERGRVKEAERERVCESDSEEERERVREIKREQERIRLE